MKFGQKLSPEAAARRSARYDASFAARFWARVDKTDGCWHWTGKLSRPGYGRVVFQGKERFAHRVSWRLAHGEDPAPGMVICHSCDVRSCVNPDHLWQGRQADNLADMAHKGRAHTGTTLTRGESNYNHRLTEAAVRDIRSRVGTTTQRALAAEYGVSPRLVAHVINRTAWKHVD